MIILTFISKSPCVLNLRKFSHCDKVQSMSFFGTLPPCRCFLPMSGKTEKNYDKIKKNQEELELPLQVNVAPIYSYIVHLDIYCNVGSITHIDFPNVIGRGSKLANI